MDGLQIVLGAPMIGGLIRALDNVLGRGDAAVTVPPLDGALRPNRKLDEAGSRLPLPGVDCLAVVSGELLSSAGGTRSTSSRKVGYGAVEVNTRLKLRALPRS